MSMNYCKCDTNYDTDYEMESIDGEMVCDNCYESTMSERFNDINGYFSESLVEHDDKVMIELKELIESEDVQGTGKFVIEMVHKYIANNK